jgi:hypothetical protein
LGEGYPPAGEAGGEGLLKLKINFFKDRKIFVSFFPLCPDSNRDISPEGREGKLKYNEFIFSYQNFI